MFAQHLNVFNITVDLKCLTIFVVSYNLKKTQNILIKKRTTQHVEGKKS